MDTYLTWSMMIDEWMNHLAVAGFSSETRTLRAFQLKRFAREFPDGPGSASAGAIAAYVAAKGWMPETIRSHLSALRGFFSWAVAAGYVEVNPTEDLPSVRPQTHLPRPAPHEAIVEALSKADSETHLMIMLAAYHGLRRGEIARIHSKDLVAEPDGTFSLVVHGKGGKDRLVPLLNEVARALEQRGKGWAWPSSSACGHYLPQTITKKIGKALPSPWTAHTLRHAFATELYDQTDDIFLVQNVLGHQSSETTRQYVIVRDSRLRAGIESLRFDDH